MWHSDRIRNNKSKEASLLPSPLSGFRPTPSTPNLQRIQTSTSTAPVSRSVQPAQTLEKIATRPSGASTGSSLINTEKAGHEIARAIDQSNPQAVNNNASHFAKLGLVPKGFPMASELQTAKEGLRQISENPVLTLVAEDESDSSRTTAVESGRSVRLAKGGMTFDKDLLPSKDGTLDIVGHGSADGSLVGGKTPAQLAKVIKDAGITQLKTLNLKSCHSEPFARALSVEIDKLNQSGANIQIGTITGAQGSIAISRLTGNSLSKVEASALNPNEFDGFLIRGLANLKTVGNVTKDRVQGEAAILPFRNINNGVEVSDVVIQAVQETVGKAVDQALQEITSKTFIGNLQSPENTALFVSGHLAHVSANVDNPDHESLMIAGVGYLIEDRVTQILLKDHGFSKENFQATIGTTRPDIVMKVGGEDVLVDLTASNSAGHILDKDKSVWFKPGIQSLEVTYPSLRIEDAKSIIKSEAIDLSAIKTAQAQAKAAQQKFDSDMKNFLRSKTLSIMNTPDYDAVPSKSGITGKRKHVAEQLHLTENPAASLKHALLKYDKSNPLLGGVTSGLVADTATQAVAHIFLNSALNEEGQELFARYKEKVGWVDPTSASADMEIADDDDDDDGALTEH